MTTELTLISSVQSGKKEAFNEIIRRYEPLIQSSIGRYLSDELFSQSDRDDLYQEAIIALYNAAMSYDLEQSEVTFGLYAKICLNNSLNSALRGRRRQYCAESVPLNDEVPAADSSSAFDETYADAGLLLKKIDDILSCYERKVLRLFIHGYSHRYIAESLGKSEKSIDNAIYRIRIKLSKNLL